MALNEEEFNELQDWLDIYQDEGLIDSWDRYSIAESLGRENQVSIDDNDMTTAIELYMAVVDTDISESERGEYIELYRDFMISLGWDEYDAHEWVDDLVSPPGGSS